mgnify:CR=1 FL=1
MSHKIPLADRAKLIKDIYQETGASIRDLSRGLGMGRSIIGRAVKMWQTKRPPVSSPRFKIKIWEIKELKAFSFGKVKLLKKYKLSEGLDFVNLMHPIHLKYSSKFQVNTLNYLFSILDKYDPKKRNDLIVNSGYLFVNIHLRKPVTGKETIAELQTEDVNYQSIKKHCYALKSSLPEPFIVNSFMNLTLGYAFHLADKTILDDTIRKNQILINLLKEKNGADEKEKDELKSWVEEIQERVKELPKRTEHYYSLYVDFCENVISRLIEEDMIKAIKNVEEDLE